MRPKRALRIRRRGKHGPEHATRDFTVARFRIWLGCLLRAPGHATILGEFGGFRGWGVGIWTRALFRGWVTCIDKEGRCGSYHPNPGRAHNARCAEIRPAGRAGNNRQPHGVKPPERCAAFRPPSASRTFRVAARPQRRRIRRRRWLGRGRERPRRPAARRPPPRQTLPAPSWPPRPFSPWSSASRRPWP